jgi:DNA-binding CsgD family transcriptional regulator
MPGARTQRYLDATAGLGQHVVARLWAEGAAMSSADAVRLALGPPQPAGSLAAYGQAGGPGPGGPGPGSPGPGSPGPGGSGLHLVPQPRPAVPESLTAREREVVALIAAGKSNRAIGVALFISPATAARHVANILAKLGYTSRSQVAVWAASAHSDQARADQAGQLAPKRADTDSPS